MECVTMLLLSEAKDSGAAVSHLVKLSWLLFKSWLHLKHGKVLLNGLLLHSRGIKETYAIMKWETLYTRLFYIGDLYSVEPTPPNPP